MVGLLTSWSAHPRHLKININTSQHVGTSRGLRVWSSGLSEAPSCFSSFTDPRQLWLALHSLYESSPGFHLWCIRDMKWPPQKITWAFHKVSSKDRKHLHVAHPRGKSSTISHQISHLDHPSGAGNWTENSSTLTQLTKGAHKKRLPGGGLSRDWFVSMREDPNWDQKIWVLNSSDLFVKKIVIDSSAALNSQSIVRRNSRTLLQAHNDS